MTATAQISWGSRTINFRLAPYILNPDSSRVVLANPSAAGVVETLSVRADAVGRIAMRNFCNIDASAAILAVDATMKRNVEQWISLARKGATPWFLARDNADKILTTTTQAVVAGDTTIHLTSTTGIVAGRKYILRSLLDIEPVNVVTVSVGQITVTEPVLFAYAVGSRFRSAFYWPARLVDMNKNPIIERPPKFFDVAFSFIEDVNLLTS